MLRSLIAALPSLRWQIPLGATTSITSAAGLLGARGVKTTTGIVGLPVDENARENYKTKLQEVLDSLKALIPADAEYRLSVEKTVDHKLTALQSDATDEQLEELFGFQLEQGIKMCKEELGLIPKMAEWAPWDVPEGYTVEIVEEKDVEKKVAAAPAGPPGAPPPPPPPPPK